MEGRESWGTRDQPGQGDFGQPANAALEGDRKPWPSKEAVDLCFGERVTVTNANASRTLAFFWI